jgi:hypothetical protein
MSVNSQYQSQPQQPMQFQQSQQSLKPQQPQQPPFPMQYSQPFDPQEMHFKCRDYVINQLLDIAKTHNVLISGDFVVYKIYYDNIVKKFYDMLESKLTKEGIYPTHSHYAYIQQEAFKNKTLFTDYTERHNRFIDTIDIWVHQDDDYIKLYHTIYATFSSYYLINCGTPSYIHENNENIDTTRKITCIIINISNPFMYKPININVMIDFTPKQKNLQPQSQYQTYNTHITPIANPSSMIETRNLEIPYGFYNHINQYIMIDYSNSNPTLGGGGSDDGLYTIAPALIKHMYDITTQHEMKEKTQALLEKIKIYIANNIVVFLSFANTETLKMLINRNGGQFNSQSNTMYFDLLISGDKSVLFWISRNNTFNSIDCTECKAPIDIDDYYIQTKCCNRTMHSSCLLDKLIYSSIDNYSDEYEKKRIEILIRSDSHMSQFPRSTTVDEDKNTIQ